MPEYRVLCSPEPVDETHSVSSNGATITRAELDAPRTLNEFAAPPHTATSPILPNDERVDASQPALLDDLVPAQQQAPWEFDSHSTQSELVALREREALLAREIAERDRRAASLEQAYRGALRDRELATSLAGKPLLDGAAAQLTKLWRDDFDVHEENGEYHVSARDGRTVVQAVAAWLSQPEYAHFCQPTTKGGSAVKGAERPASSVALDSEPKNLGEAVVRRWQDVAARRTREASGPIGLGRRHLH